MNFALYGKSGLSPITLDQLREENEKTESLIARAEESGCEACYVEVAKWNQHTRQCERYAFAKCFQGDNPFDPNANCIQTAQLFAKMINDAGRTELDPMIHRLPDYNAPEPRNDQERDGTVLCAVQEAQA